MKKRFEELYKTYRDTVYGYLYYMCREEELARDLAQETFLKIFLGLKKFRGESSEKTWCLTIARNTFLSYARKKQPMLLGDAMLEEQQDTGANRPEEHMIRQEEGELVRQVLASLAEEERTLLLLRDYEELPYEEIARILNLTESNVKVKIYRARQKYRKLYLQEIRWMEERKMTERILIPKVSYEGNDRDLKEQVVHYEKGTRRIFVFTVVGLLMGWFSYRYYGETFLPLKILLAIPYKLSELLHNALHPAVYAGEAMLQWDAFFPQAPYISRLAEYGTAALFGGAIYGSLAYFTGDKRIFTLTKYVRFGCIWAVAIGVWTGLLLGANAWQVSRNNALKDVSGFFICSESSGRGYYLHPGEDLEKVSKELRDTFYQGEGPVEVSEKIRDREGELELELFFGTYQQGAMVACIHPEEGYLVTDEGRVYEMTDAFMEVYRKCLEVENYEAVED